MEKRSVGRKEKDGSKVHRQGEDGISVTLIDPDVLDCSICMDILIPPVFQCTNGHILCSSCCTKLGNKCPSCSRSIAYSRCLAMEKLLESIEISCPNVQYGCKERVRYSQKRNHEATCNYAPCECPFSNCTFHCSFEQFSQHFSSKHMDSVIYFHYNLTFPVSLGRNEQVLVFQEEEGLLFLLNNRTEFIGNAISVTCFGPSSPRGGFLYDLTASREGNSLKIWSFTKSTKGEIEGSSMDFLLIPCHFYGYNGQVELEVRIRSTREFN